MRLAQKVAGMEFRGRKKDVVTVRAVKRRKYDLLLKRERQKMQLKR